MKLLAINGGSSSVKCRLDDLHDAPSEPATPFWQAHIDSHENLESTLRSVPKPVDAVVHRIVHGGKQRATTRITAQVREAIAQEVEVAPAHNKFELRAIDISQSVSGRTFLKLPHSILRFMRRSNRLPMFIPDPTNGSIWASAATDSTA